MLTERAELYKCRPPEVLRFPLLVCQSYIEDGIPTGAEVTAAVRGLNGDRARGPSGMQVED